MASKTNIPPLSPELIANIISYLHDKPVLACLSLVSKSFNAIATPALYATFRDGDTHHMPTLERFYTFIRTILEKPDLAKLVKSVALGSPGNDETYGEEPDDILSALCEQQVRKLFEGPLVAHLTITVEEWLEVLKEPPQDPVYAILLSALPNLETLFFEEAYEPKYLQGLLTASDAACEASHKAGNDIFGSGIPFSRLHSLRTMSTDGKYGYMVFYELAPFFRLPSMKAIEICLANGEWSDSDGQNWNLAARSSSVERLSLQSAAVTDPCIRLMLNSIAALKAFHFTYGKIHMYGQDFTPAELLKSLISHADSLEVLQLNYDDDWDKVLWDEDTSEDIEGSKLYLSTDLRKLTKLKILKVSNASLFGFLVDDEKRTDSAASRLGHAPEVHLPDMLPESLEELEIIACDARVVPHLQTLADARGQDRFQALRQVRCLFVKEKTDENVTKIELPSVQVTYEFLDSQERENLLYDTRGEELNDSSIIFDSDMLLGTGM